MKEKIFVCTEERFFEDENWKETLLNVSAVIVCIYMILFALSLVFGGRKVADHSDRDIQVYVDSVTVKEGDNLWKIAKAYESEFYESTFDYVIAIKECNGLKDDLIHPGMNIMVPYTVRNSSHP